MEKNREKLDCPLYDSHECHVLNMEDCSHCPMTQDEGETPERLREAVATFERLLPEAGIACLFESATCCFCHEPKQNEKSGYAILSMAHPEPRYEKTILTKRWKYRSPVGTMVQIQPAICSACRRKLLLLDYITTAMTVLGCGTGLLFFTGSFGESLEKIAGWLPFFCWVLISCLGYGSGRLLKSILKKHFSSDMFVDFADHPIIVEMREKGWFLLPKDRETSYVFTNSRKKTGLGTAPDAVYKENSSRE